MAVILPTCPPVRDQSLRLVTYASIQTPILGGPETRVLRMGDRFAGDFTTYVAPYRDEGRKFLARLLRGLTDTVVIGIKEPAMDFTGYGAPLVAAGASGSTIPMTGIPSGKVIPEGKFFSVISNGQRFLYQVSADTTSAGGTTNIPVYPMVRAGHAVGNAVEFSAPKMEGFLSGSEQGWNVSLSKRIGFQFSITERM